MSEPEKVDHKAAVKKYILGAEKRHKKLSLPIEEMEKSATKGEARRKLKKFLSKGL